MGRRIGVLWPEHASYILGRVTAYAPEVGSLSFCFLSWGAVARACFQRPGRVTTFAPEVCCISAEALVQTGTYYGMQACIHLQHAFANHSMVLLCARQVTLRGAACQR